MLPEKIYLFLQESPEHTKKVLIVSPQDLIDLNKNPETLVIAYSIAPETVQNSSIMPNESLSFNQTTKHFFSGQQAKIVAGPVAFAPSKKSKEKKGQPRSANPNPNNIVD